MKFEDILPVQTQKEKIGNLRVDEDDSIKNSQNTPDEFKDFPTLTLKLDVTDVDPLQYCLYVKENEILEKYIKVIRENIPIEAKTGIYDSAESIMVKILMSSNQIAIDTRRGTGNTLIVHSSVIEKINGDELADRFEIIENDGICEDGCVLKYRGKLNSIVSLYEYEGDQLEKDEAIIYYKGSGEFDSGIILNWNPDNKNQYQIIATNTAKRYFKRFKV